MLKKIAIFIALGLFAISISGCALLLAGAAGGAGTSVWLSGKLTQEVNADFLKSVSSAKSALKSLKFDIEKETIKEDVVQLISKYSDGRQIWIDIHRISEKASRIEVRVGATGDKGAAQKILDRIKHYI